MGRASGPVCERCGGTGWVIVQREGGELASRCDCRQATAVARLLARSRIPERYAHCTVDEFVIWDDDPGGRRLLTAARRRTREFIDLYPATGRGLLFIGPSGVGKTHLAVAALRELIVAKGVRGLYANAIELVQELQMSFDGGGRSREEIIQPVASAELVVIDELGGGKVSPFVLDLLYYILNARYMQQRLTLVTTNFGDHPGSEGTSQLRTHESLADRISPALRSRLYEMCDQVEIRCSGDYRQWTARAPMRGR